MSDYEPTDSDYDYDENEKILLESVRKRKDHGESEEEVLAFESSESEKDDFDEDIENYEDDLPDAKAWGRKKKNYYNTDYVDPDYGGFQGEDAEDAENEEQEARAIQERLMQELDEADYMLHLAPESGATEEKVEEKIKTDVSGLSKRDKRILFAKESPEFAGLVEDFKEKMSEIQSNLEPIILLINNGKIPDSPVSKYIKTKYHLILNYCNNILYYLLLKARRVAVQSHPVIQRLFQYRQFLKQLESIDSNIQSQLDIILEKINRDEEVEIENVKKKDRRRKLKKISKSVAEDDNDSGEVKDNNMVNNNANTANAMEVDREALENERRGITYQIAKNKGLTPHRKKELRNPRVKHRKKFEKAKIRRKGQVREPRKELQRYGGEISGIKIGISKSIKLQ